MVLLEAERCVDQLARPRRRRLFRANPATESVIGQERFSVMAHQYK